MVLIKNIKVKIALNITYCVTHNILIIKTKITFSFTYYIICKVV